MPGSPVSLYKVLASMSRTVSAPEDRSLRGQGDDTPLPGEDDKNLPFVDDTIGTLRTAEKGPRRLHHVRHENPRPANERAPGGAPPATRAPPARRAGALGYGARRPQA